MLSKITRHPIRTRNRNRTGEPGQTAAQRPVTYLFDTTSSQNRQPEDPPNFCFLTRESSFSVKILESVDDVSILETGPQRPEQIAAANGLSLDSLLRLRTDYDLALVEPRQYHGRSFEERHAWLKVLEKNLRIAKALARIYGVDLETARRRLPKPLPVSFRIECLCIALIDRVARQDL